MIELWRQYFFGVITDPYVHDGVKVFSFNLLFLQVPLDVSSVQGGEDWGSPDRDHNHSQNNSEEWGGCYPEGWKITIRLIIRKIGQEQDEEDFFYRQMRGCLIYCYDPEIRDAYKVSKRNSPSGSVPKDQTMSVFWDTQKVRPSRPQCLEIHLTTKCRGKLNKGIRSLMSLSEFCRKCNFIALTR